MLWSLADPRPDGLVVVEYPYFETAVCTSPRRRATSTTTSRLASPDIVHLQPRPGRVITALMDAGMQLTAIEEHDSVPWNPLGEAMENIGGDEFRLCEAPERLAATYTLQAAKPAD